MMRNSELYLFIKYRYDDRDRRKYSTRRIQETHLKFWLEKLKGCEYLPRHEWKDNINIE
jgi:hypothetical protein